MLADAPASLAQKMADAQFDNIYCFSLPNDRSGEHGQFRVNELQYLVNVKRRSQLKSKCF